MTIIPLFCMVKKVAGCVLQKNVLKHSLLLSWSLTPRFLFYNNITFAAMVWWDIQTIKVNSIWPCSHLLVLQASEELEDRESLAAMAASGQTDEETGDGETFMEKYTRGISAVETILTLDRLRQSVAVKELLNAKSRHKGKIINPAPSTAGSSQFMRKTVSVPSNMSHVSWSFHQMSI